jgi:hypothetical protein
MSNEEHLKKRIIQRFAAADFVLSELEKGRFPNLSRFLKNARFNLRQITDREPFEDRTQQPDIETLLAASRASGTVHLSMDPVPRISLFYDKELSEAEASLFATSLQKVAAVAFAALGLDMSGLVSVEESLTLDDRSAEKK